MQDPDRRNGDAVILENPLPDPLDLGTDWFAVGNSADGALAIENGGAVSNYVSIIGYDSGSTGEVTVDGDGSTWNSAGLFVGDSGNGKLNITGGGAVSNMFSSIGSLFSGKGEVTVDGGSTWTNSSDLRVGGYGSGVMNITSSGVVINSIGTIGLFSSSTGEVTVDGADSTWTNSSDLRVGGYGSGRLNITGSGAVSSTTGDIGLESCSTGKVTVDGIGSTWTNSSDLTVGQLGRGVLIVSDGGAVSNNDGYVGSSSGSKGDGIVDGIGSTWTNNDNLYVGYSGNGALSITDGGLVSVSGTLTINDDAIEDDYIIMATGGMLALNGVANNSLLDFLGLIDGSDVIRYWNGSIWDDINNATYGDDYMLEYLNEGDLTGYTRLTVNTPEPSADLDDDGDIDGNDFLAWQRGESSIPLSSFDLYNWQSSFGDIASSVAAVSTGVPEPSTAALLAMGLAVVVTWQRVR